MLEKVLRRYMGSELTILDLKGVPITGIIEEVTDGFVILKTKEQGTKTHYKGLNLDSISSFSFVTDSTPTSLVDVIGTSVSFGGSSGPIAPEKVKKTKKNEASSSES